MLYQFVEAFRHAWRALRGYVLRTFLTTLGITVGIFAITLTFTFVDSMEYSVSKNLDKLGNTTLLVHKWPWKDNSNDWQKYYKRPKMSFADYRALRKGLDDILAIAIRMDISGVTVSSELADVQGMQAVGVTYEFEQIEQPTYTEGRYFTPVEVANGRPVVVLGGRLADNLFGSRSKVGQSVRIKGRKLTVVGVLERKGESLLGNTIDDMAFIPYSIAAQMAPFTRGVDKTVAIRAVSYDRVPAVEDQITAILRNERGLRPGTENNFSINKQEALMEQIGSFFGVVNTGGLFISIFALIVGGFGIANIMFVAVKERTKEIGLQKALGARRGFIVLEFMIEAILLCLAGAAVGLVLLMIIYFFGQQLLASFDVGGLTLVLTPRSLLYGVFFAVFTGLLAGILPALSASKLDPVVAIRQG